jgi:hypothetical protein
MPVYKVSYVVTGSDYPGSIANSESRPEVGDRITLGDKEFIITEVIDLHSRGDICYVHATCRPYTGVTSELG